jgi:hypothetical protein
LSWTTSMNLFQNILIFWMKSLIQMISNSKSFVDNFKKIASLNWLWKILSRRRLNSLVAFQRRRKISKHYISIFQRTSKFIFIKILF